MARSDRIPLDNPVARDLVELLARISVARRIKALSGEEEYEKTESGGPDSQDRGLVPSIWPPTTKTPSGS